MGQSVKKRVFSKKEINQKWCEVLDATRQYASCPDDDEQLLLYEMQLRSCLKLYLIMEAPFVSGSEVTFWIKSYACDPGFEPLSDDQKYRLRNKLDQIVNEKRNWGQIDGLRKSFNRLKKSLKLKNNEH